MPNARLKLSLYLISLFFVFCCPGLLAFSAEEKLTELISKEVCSRNSFLESARIIVEFKNKTQLSELNQLLSPEGGSYFLKLRPSSQTRLLGDLVVPLMIEKGKEIFKYNLSLKISAIKKVVKTTALLKKYSLIKSSDVILAEGNLAELPRDVFFDIQDVLGKETAFTVPANRVLTAPLVRNIPDIKKDSPVNLEVSLGNIFIKTQVIALSDGYVGKKILVVNPTMKKKLEGVVKDQQTVVLRLN
jgi:flagella basal body P-ring formation protein FlgA